MTKQKRMKYSAGERVKVRKDLFLGKRYFMDDKIDFDVFSKGMAQFAGREATIIDVVNGKYLLDIDVFHLYTDEMLNKFVDVKARKEYDYNSEVEDLINHMLKQIPQQLIDHALDTGNKELFMKLTNIY